MCGSQSIICKGWLSPSISSCLYPEPSFLLAVVSASSLPLLSASGKPLTLDQKYLEIYRLLLVGLSPSYRAPNMPKSLLGPTLGSQHPSILDLRTNDKGQMAKGKGQRAKTSLCLQAEPHVKVELCCPCIHTHLHLLKACLKGVWLSWWWTSLACTKSWVLRPLS